MDLAADTRITAAVTLRNLGGAVGSYGIGLPPKMRAWMGWEQAGATVQLTTAVIDGRRCVILSALEPVGVK